MNPIPMRKRLASFLATLLCTLGCSYSAAAPAASQPNVVVIISDDQAWGEYGFMGHPHLATPALDRLAAQSITFTRPKLWDMPDEEAAALMRQWTAFEPGMPDVVVVRCEFTAQRDDNDRWGPAKLSPHEIPACYSTRNFGTVKTYLGDQQWRTESQPPGPPWGKTQPPRKAMALFAPNGQGVAVFSPVATQPWNFGPHAGGASDDPKAGPCMHVAPIDRVMLGPKSTYRYRYWLLVGTEPQIAARLDALWEKYSAERAGLIPR